MSYVWDPVELGFVDLDERAPDEQMGSKDKGWVRLAGDERRWLMKLSRTDDLDGTVSGEDWAEWVVQHLAGLLGVPVALVRPAHFEGNRAIVSRSVLRDSSDVLAHGNELLAGCVSGYETSKRGEVKGYTPKAVREALHGVAPPSEVAEPAEFSGFDAWCGYVLMDAWVSGRDRHHENWAVIQRDGTRSLSPSFDHGNALGFQLRDEKRDQMLRDSVGFAAFVRKGCSPHFEGRPHLVDVAIESLGLASLTARDYWFDSLRSVNEDAIEAILVSVPGTVMSDVCRMFVMTLLDHNRRRILNVYSAT